MSEPGHDRAGPSTSDRLEEARQRLTRLEVEAHRLRADLARMEADREDTIADAMELGREPLNRAEAPLQATPDSPPPVFHATPHPAAKRYQPTPADRAVSSKDSVPAEPARPAFTPATGARFSAGRGSVEAPGTPRAQRPRGAIVSSKPLPRRRGGRNPGAKPGTKRRRNKTPSWVISVLVHVALLLLFGLATFATLQNDPQLFFASASETDDLNDEMLDFSEFEFEESDLEDVQFEEVALESVVENAMELESPEMESSAAAQIGDSLSDLAAMDVGSLMTAVNVGGSTDGGTAGQGSGDASGGRMGSISFFGRKVQAGRVMFVLDNSASMVDGRMETALLEVQRSVAALSPKQSFYVCVYSDEAFPMFYPQPTLEMIPATPANKQRLASWLTTVPIGPGDYRSQIAALEGAVNLRPDVIYLLTDEDIRSSVAKEFLLTPKRFGVPMHVFGMTATNADGIALLEAIAAAQGGGYQDVTISPDAQSQAKARPIRRYRKPDTWMSSTTAPGVR
ncbi:hypothetical protein Pla175_16490 [Pirellulimonas nuda]|uniref:VWFA domain-containing protein n=1 Tax=Pirellulimonas nuda TaxID=2528009 RepID=A0A518D9V8_9BACT|nr:vWA domain-containing protein [Pirellulimonas nuda]QDU88275.1 hypothetical protein Pla175_16490 [Pirellulimonas nuda]